MKILFIGGTGLISSACSKLVVKRGMELFLLNRGMGTKYTVGAVARMGVGKRGDSARCKHYTGW